MNVNGITSVTSAYTTDKSKQTAAKERSSSKSTSYNAQSDSLSSGVIYESSANTVSENSVTKTTQTTDLVAQLKEQAQERADQFRSIVDQMLAGQGNAIGTADSMWSLLRTGNFTVDAETKAQAQKDVAEDGYWGVEQTSSRIVDFAKALSGGDADKLEELRAAFEKGFKMAEEKWGGTLPDISQRTYEAVQKKFDEWALE